MVFSVIGQCILKEFGMATVLDDPRQHDGVRRFQRDQAELETSETEHEGVDLEAIKRAVRTILRAVGEDPDRPGLLETPRRVAKMYAEMFEGLHQDPARHLKVTFPEDYDELVLVRDIPFTSMCEHHLLPFTGVAHVGYIPHGRVTGLSKLARVVEEVAKRPQVQERMTQTVADLIERELETSGVAVVVQAEHSCMGIRGVKKHGSSTITSALRGVFKTNQASRAEVLSLIGQKTP
jgi:GTP cyclohydrolase I